MATSNKTERWLNNIKVLGEFTLLLFGSIIVPLMFIINVYLNYSLSEINSSSLNVPISRLFSILLAGSALGIYFAIYKSEARLKDAITTNNPSKILKFLGVDISYYSPDSLNKLLVIGMGVVIVQIAAIIITIIAYKTSKEATLLTLMMSFVNIVVGVIMDFVVGGHYSTLQEKLKKD